MKPLNAALLFFQSSLALSPSLFGSLFRVSLSTPVTARTCSSALSRKEETNAWGAAAAELSERIVLSVALASTPIEKRKMKNRIRGEAITRERKRIVRELAGLLSLSLSLSLSPCSSLLAGLCTRRERRPLFLSQLSLSPRYEKKEMAEGVPRTAAAEELAEILPLLRRPELLASLRFVGRAAPASTVKPGLIREVLAVLRGSEGRDKRDAISKRSVIPFPTSASSSSSTIS